MTLSRLQVRLVSVWTGVYARDAPHVDRQSGDMRLADNWRRGLIDLVKE